MQNTIYKKITVANEEQIKQYKNRNIQKRTAYNVTPLRAIKILRNRTCEDSGTSSQPMYKDRVTAAETLLVH